MSHVFVSYARADAQFARVVASQIHQAGINVWVDEDLPPGENWRESIDQAIRDAFAIVVLVSPEAKASEYVTYEWAFAWGAGLSVIPLVLRPTRLHPRLEALHHLDFTNPINQPWNRLLDRLRGIEKAHNNSAVRVPQGAPSAVRRAVEALDSHNADERRSAIESLDQTNHAAAYEVLLAALNHPMRDVRIYAMRRLGRRSSFRDTRAVSGLVRALSDAHVDVRADAARLLGRIGGNAASLALVDALDDKDARVSATAHDALISLGIDRVTRSVVETVLPGGSLARYQAAERAMRRIGADLRRALYDMLSSDDPTLRRAAILMVGAAQREESLSRLLALFDHPDEETEAALRGALRAWDPAVLVPALLRFTLTDENRPAATTTGELRAMRDVRSGGGGGGEEETQPTNRIDRRRLQAEAALAVLGRSAIPVMIAQLANDDGHIRRAAAAQLLRRRTEVVPDLLLTLNTHRDLTLRLNVVRLLGAMGDAESVPDLIACLDSEHRSLQELAAQALTRIGTPPARRAVDQWRERRARYR